MSSSGSGFIDLLSNLFEKVQPLEVDTGCDYRVALGCIVEILTIDLIIHDGPSAI